MARLAFAAPLRHRRFRLLFAGSAVSGIGDWMDYLALVVLIAYTWDQGPGGLAALSLAMAAPWVLVAPVAGVLADRIADKRRALILCDLLRCALVAGYFLAPGIEILLVFVLLKGVCSTVFNPAYQATLVRVVPKEDLLQATALGAFVSQATKVAGPAFGGLLVSGIGVRGVFVADAVSFLVSAAFLARLDLPPTPRGAARPAASGATSPGRPAALERRRWAGRFRGEFAEGVRFIAATPALLAVTLSMAASLFLVLTFDILSPLALKELGIGESMLGLVIAAVGAGAVTGTLVAAQWGRGWNPFALMGGGQVVTGALVCGIGAAVAAGLAGTTAVWVPVAFGIGLASSAILVVYPYVLRRETPEHLMGRVSATTGAVPTVLQLAAPPVAAALAAWQGLSFVLVCSGGGLAVTGLLLLLWSARRRPRTAASVPASADGAPATAAATESEPPAATASAPRTAPEAPARTDAPVNRHRRSTPPGSPAGSRPPEGPEGAVMSENLRTLDSAGIPTDRIPEGQREVLAALSADELAVLTSVKERVDAAVEVQAHAEKDRDDTTVGVVIW
ncbi:MFS transporter [Streptomyces sp. TRM 70351]|uniref:MFS transporter n=1 Tax=Streptomyces sp. TRM 70351 TaxID=3116552 RepID=UPI002E7B2305|nr:MFS transporter [Streptomyces sp. TRM 70351]MEE1928284.1 MFS transporter [Streptomyces sp. TRM 70351]